MPLLARTRKQPKQLRSGVVWRQTWPFSDEMHGEELVLACDIHVQAEGNCRLRAGLLCLPGRLPRSQGKGRMGGRHLPMTVGFSSRRRVV